VDCREIGAKASGRKTNDFGDERQGLEAALTDGLRSALRASGDAGIRRGEGTWSCAESASPFLDVKK